MRVDLELDPGSEPVAGRLAVPGGDARKFTGYAGLIAALEALREAADVAAASLASEKDPS